MERIHYFCALTSLGLRYFRKTQINPLEKIKSSLDNIIFDQTATEAGAIFLGENSEAEMQSYSQWFTWFLEQEALTLSTRVLPDEAGLLPDGSIDPYMDMSECVLFCPQKSLAWNFREEPSPRFKITPEQFLMFIEQQTEPALFREAVLSFASNYSATNFSKPLADSELNEFLHSSEGPIFFEYNGESLWYEVRDKYVTADRAFVIKDEFSDLISEEDDYFDEGEKCYSFKEADNHSIIFAFKLVVVSQENSLVTPEYSIKNFRQALHDIADLAVKIDSPFNEAFSSSLSLLECSQKRFSLMELVKECQTTDKGREIINRQSGPLKLFETLDADPVVLGQLLACEVADVFGGMGSWNDQHIPMEYQDEYSRISANFYSALEEFKTGLITRLA